MGALFKAFDTSSHGKLSCWDLVQGLESLQIDAQRPRAKAKRQPSHQQIEQRVKQQAQSLAIDGLGFFDVDHRGVRRAGPQKNEDGTANAETPRKGEPKSRADAAAAGDPASSADSKGSVTPLLVPIKKSSQRDLEHRLKAELEDLEKRMADFDKQELAAEAERKRLQAEEEQKRKDIEEKQKK